MTQTTPRIPPLPREEWTDAARECFAYWGETDAWENGSATNIVNTFASHPPLSMAYNVFGKHLLLGSTVPIRQRELVVLRMSWLLKCEYEWHYHVGYGLTAGMTLEEVAAVRDGPDAAVWDEKDAAVLRACDEFKANDNVSDATWAVLAKHFDRSQIMDLVFTIGHYVMVSWALNAFGVELEDGADQIDYDLKRKSGAPVVASYRPGEVEDWEEKRNLTR